MQCKVNDIPLSREDWFEKEAAALAEARRERIEEDFDGGNFSDEFDEALRVALGAGNELTNQLWNQVMAQRILARDPTWPEYWEHCRRAFGRQFCGDLRDKIIEREMEE